MEIRRWMKHPLLTVKPRDSIQHVREMMEKHRVNQLPVLVDGRLVGIITDRDLRDAFPSVFDSSPFSRRKPKISTTDPRKVTVEMVMTSNVSTVAPGDSMADAARLMRRERIGALPVVEGQRVVGILTRSDVLNGFIDLVELEDVRESSLVVGQAAAKPRTGRAAAKPRTGQAVAKPRTGQAVAKPRTGQAVAKPRTGQGAAKPGTARPRQPAAGASRRRSS